MTIVLNCWELEDSKGASASSLTIPKPVVGPIPQWVNATWQSSKQWAQRVPSNYYGPSWVSGITWKSETSWAWDKPSGEYPKNPQPGDLLIILVGNGSAEDTAQWDNSTLKPTGFTFINEAGAADQDCHCAAFYKVVDGTEGTTFSIPAASSDYMWAFCILISADGPLFIHKTGADSAVANAVLATPLTMTEVTTTVAKCLGLFVAAYDGADDGGFTCDGTGWLEQAENRSGTAAASAAGVFGKKSLTLAGASGSATVYAASGDGMVGFQFAIGESSAFVGTVDDQWLNTVDDFWFGINIVVTVIAARVKSRSYKLPRPIYTIPSTVKFPKGKLGATKLPALSAFNVYLKSKFAGIKASQGKPKALLTRVIRVTAKFAGTKLGATRVLRSVHAIQEVVKFAGVKLRGTKLPPLWAYIPATVKFVGVKIRATVPGALSPTIVTVKNAISKLVATRLPIPKIVMLGRVKAAGVKLGAHKPPIELWVQAFVRTSGIKLGSTKSALIRRITISAKNVRLKIGALKSSIWFVLDFFKDTVDDFWVSTLDDEWLGHFILRIKNARLKLVARKDKPYIAIPVTLKRVGVKLRFRRSIVGAYYANLELAVKNARLKLRARKATLTAYMAVIALILKNAGTKLRATKPVLDFHFLWTTVKNAGVKFHIQRFTGWYINIQLKAARIKLLAKKTQFSLRLAVRTARVKLRARRLLLVRRITIAARFARVKLRARKDALILRIVMRVKRARIKMVAKRDILARVVRITLKRAGLKLRVTKPPLSFSFATITLALKNVGYKLRATKSVIGFAEATISLVLKNAGTKIRSGVSTLRFSWMTPLTVKRARLKMRANKSNTMARFFTLTVKAVRLKIGASKGRLVRVVTVAAKTVGVKVRFQISHLVTSFITLTVVATGIKTGATRSIASSIHTLGTKIATFKIGATKRTLSSGTILWRGLIKFMTRALSYRFSSSGDAVKFDTRAEVYRFVSKND